MRFGRLVDLWLTPAGQSFVAGVVIVALFAPAHWLGWAWIAPCLSLLFGFVIGWAAARRFWRRNGYVPKL